MINITSLLKLTLSLFIVKLKLKWLAKWTDSNLTRGENNKKKPENFSTLSFYFFFFIFKTDESEIMYLLFIY